MASGLYSKHLKNKKKLYIRNSILVAVLIIFAIISLFPIFPKSWSLDSYKAFLNFNQYSLRWLWNSVVVAVAVALGNVIFAGMAGYAFAKIDFKGRKFLFYLVLMAMMIPYQVVQVPLYILLVSKFQLTNSYISLILPGVCTSYNIFLAKQFFASIPTALIESAKLEGCNQFKIYRFLCPKPFWQLWQSTPSLAAGTTSFGRSW